MLRSPGIVVGAVCVATMISPGHADFLPRAAGVGRSNPSDGGAVEGTLPEGWTSNVDFPGWLDPVTLGNSSDQEPSDEEVDSVEVSASSRDCVHNSYHSSCYLYLACVLSAHPRSQTYCDFGGYMIVPTFPISGTESITRSNAGDVDYLMVAAYNRCSSSSCVLMVNPIMHRTQNQLHLHYRHYNAGGTILKQNLEAVTCNETTAWHGFNMCAYGQARAFEGFPNVFSEVVAGCGQDSLNHVAITVFPSACGGAKTIVLTGMYCSIEHDISAR